MSDELENIELENQSTIAEDLYWAIKTFFSKERPTASVGGESHPASDFLYVPDPSKPSTWKLPVFDESHMAAAAAALGSGFRGKKVSMPASAIAACKRKLRGMYRSMGKTMPDSLKENSGLMLWKDKDGTYRWFAFHTNNFRDDDNPSEILAKEAHLAFNDAVEKGLEPYPELWHWHVKGSAWGKADWLHFDEDTGMEMASGYVLPGHEKEAEALADTDELIGVSHGMPSESITRSKEDNSIITRYTTREISDLPLWAAANKLTSFVVLKEQDMTIPDKKREYLTEHGVSEDQMAAIEELNKELGKEAKEAGLESKEAGTVEETPTQETPTTETPVVVEKKETETPVYATNQEVADAIVAVTKSLTEMFEAKFKELQDAMTELKSKEVSPDPTPTASLAALIAQKMRATDAPANVVNKNTKFAKSGPEETVSEKDQKPVVSTGNPIMDATISRIVGK